MAHGDRALRRRRWAARSVHEGLHATGAQMKPSIRPSLLASGYTGQRWDDSPRRKATGPHVATWTVGLVALLGCGTQSPSLGGAIGSSDLGSSEESVAEYQLSITSPAAKATVSGTIQVVGIGPGFQNVEIHSASDALLVRVTPDSAGNFSASVDTNQLPLGSNVLTIDGWNAPAGQSFTQHAQVSLTLTVQSVAEYQLSITSPAAKATVGGTVQVVGIGPGFQNVEVHSASDALLARVTPDSAGNFSAPVDTTQLPEGSDVLTIDGWNAPAGQSFTEHAQVSL